MEKVTRLEYERLTGRQADDGDDVQDFLGVPIGTDLRCLHCGQDFTLGTELVDLSDGLLVCPHEGCNGSPLDWYELVDRHPHDESTGDPLPPVGSLS